MNQRTCLSYRLERDQQNGYVLFMQNNVPKPQIGAVVRLPPRRDPDLPGGLYRVTSYAPDFYSERAKTLYMDVYVEEVDE